MPNNSIVRRTLFWMQTRARLFIGYDPPSVWQSQSKYALHEIATEAVYSIRLRK
jgi:hypothetical protein